MRAILTAILLLLLFSGCTQKVVVQKELLCYDLQNQPIGKDVKVRVQQEDINVFNARNDELKKAIKFYENQNRLYKLECEK